jgi:hypothetical protein
MRLSGEPIVEYHLEVHEIWGDAPFNVGAVEVRLVVDLFEVLPDVADALLDLVVLAGPAAEGGNDHVEEDQEDHAQKYEQEGFFIGEGHEGEGDAHEEEDSKWDPHQFHEELAEGSFFLVYSGVVGVEDAVDFLYVPDVVALSQGFAVVLPIVLLRLGKALPVVVCLHHQR